MSWYQDHMLPKLIACAMRNEQLIEYRQRVVPSASGRVLEIGVGAGANMPFYTSRASQIIGLDPSEALLRISAGAQGDISSRLIAGSAEAIPLDARSIDTIISTWTMCSIPDISAALREMARVLKPGGRLLFVEHGSAPGPVVAWMQNKMTPIWRRIGGGCHLNRPIDRLIEANGWRIEKIERGFMHGPNPATYMYEGTACAA